LYELPWAKIVAQYFSRVIQAVGVKKKTNKTKQNKKNTIIIYVMLVEAKLYSISHCVCVK